MNYTRLVTTVGIISALIVGIIVSTEVYLLSSIVIDALETATR